MRLLCSVIILTLITGAYFDENNHIYEEGEEVVLWMNTVGPYYNKQETYVYFSLPFCVGSKETINHYHATLSEALQGVKLENTGINIEFKSNISREEFCIIQLNEQKYKAFVYAVKNNYWYQMYIDDLPIWSVVGEVKDNKYYIWTHKKFEIGYNGKQIVDVNFTAGGKIELTPVTQLTFTYEVIWTRSHVKFENRFDKYLNYDSFQHKIHSYGIYSSFIIVTLLVGVVTMILWIRLRKDYARYTKDHDHLDKMKTGIVEEYGWKQVHGDTFRPPSHSLYFSALIGAGSQLTTVAFFAICYAALGEVYTKRGSLLSTSIFIYTVTSPINGYFGGSLYSRMGGEMWKEQMIVSAFILPIFAFSYPFYINLIAVYYESSRVISFGTVVEVISICIFVILPLTVIGAVSGRELAGQPDNPCRINTVPRSIPEKKWFLKSGVIFLLSGVLPFASIFIEIYFIFTSFWTSNIYYVYEFMLLIFINLIIVTICITVVYTYLLLNAEDHQWQWIPFLIAASTSTYVYIYAIFYFFFKTKMYGLFQTTLYFGYMALFCGALGVICGTVGYIGASIFVKKIYSSIKIPIGQDDDTDCPKISKWMYKDSDECTENNDNFIFVGKGNDMLFSQEAAEDIAYEELPDDFFELTRTRAINVLRIIKKQRYLLKNAPLLTTNWQNLEESKKRWQQMKEHKKSIIRVQFPDRVVFQGTFNPSDTIKDVIEFVRQYLEDKSINFYLFTTPPKFVLEENRMLVEEGFLPGAVVHFGTDDLCQKNYLRKDLQSKFSINSVENLAEPQIREENQDNHILGSVCSN